MKGIQLIEKSTKMLRVKAWAYGLWSVYYSFKSYWFLRPLHWAHES